MAEKLEALAVRCEQATGPDRELDGLVEVARDPMRETILYNKPGRFPREAVRGPVKDLVLSGRDLADYINAPAYTASVDAALTLVPEGHFFAVSTHPRGAFAIVGATEDGEAGRSAEAVATPALALTAAALRAHKERTPNVG